MEKKDCLTVCRYYKEEEHNPYKDHLLSWFWNMERVYVRNNGKFEGENDYYKAIGGKSYPGIPFDLLMLMFTSWAKYTYDIKNKINDFYLLVDEYLFIANDHFPEDKIPNSK